MKGTESLDQVTRLFGNREIDGHILESGKLKKLKMDQIAVVLFDS